MARQTRRHQDEESARSARTVEAARLDPPEQQVRDHEKRVSELENTSTESPPTP
jgi:hypothetical protein